jgi:hypothetical protein
MCPSSRSVTIGAVPVYGTIDDVASAAESASCRAVSCADTVDAPNAHGLSALRPRSNSSRIEPAGTSPFTSATIGVLASLVTCLRSVAGSNFTSGTAQRHSSIELSCTSSVWPSAGCCSTRCVPTQPSAPARFSTTTGWPHCEERSFAISRARASVPPPAA